MGEGRGRQGGRDGSPPRHLCTRVGSDRLSVVVVHNLGLPLLVGAGLGGEQDVERAPALGARGARPDLLPPPQASGAEGGRRVSGGEVVKVGPAVRGGEGGRAGRPGAHGS
eukprot:scaffold14173_cov73-Isochrysis_galbana.AAC.1